MQAYRALRSKFRHARVGLLGGSFNPPHAGHVYISQQALKRLQLDAVWWLISPQNPLKSDAETLPLKARLAQCEALLAKEKRIIPTALEAEFGTRYTVDSLTMLRRHFPTTEFVWLMGADNLAQFHRWKQWQHIVQLAPLAVLDRRPSALRALHSKTARYLRRYQVIHPDALHTPPAWLFLPIRTHPASSTALRQQANGGNQ